MSHTLRISGPAEIIMLKIVKDSVLRVSRSFGYDIVPLREMKERDFALHLRELLAHLDIDCVLDVGANAGQYHDFLRDRVQYDGPIISFEPVSHHIDALRERSRGDRDWHIEGYALGSSDGSMPINVMVSDQFSSFLEPDHGRVKDYAGLNVPCHTETVTVRTRPDTREDNTGAAALVPRTTAGLILVQNAATDGSVCRPPQRTNWLRDWSDPSPRIFATGTRQQAQDAKETEHANVDCRIRLHLGNTLRGLSICRNWQL